MISKEHLVHNFSLITMESVTLPTHPYIAFLSFMALITSDTPYTLLACLFVSIMWALEYKCNEGKEFILFTLNPQSLEKCLAHSRPSTVTWMNNYMSSCVTHELNSKTSWSEDCTFWKESLGLRRTKVRTQMDKWTKTKNMDGYSWALSEFHKKSSPFIGSVWAKRHVAISICFLSHSTFSTFESSTTVTKLRQKIYFGVICKSPHEKFRWEQVQLSKDGTAIISQKRSLSYRLYRA